jgi:hypothetical protein
MSFYVGLVLVFVLTESLSLLNYLAADKIFAYLVPKKLKSKKSSFEENLEAEIAKSQALKREITLEEHTNINKSEEHLKSPKDQEIDSFNPALNYSKINDETQIND